MKPPPVIKQQNQDQEEKKKKQQKEGDNERGGERQKQENTKENQKQELNKTRQPRVVAAAKTSHKIFSFFFLCQAGTPESWRFRTEAIKTTYLNPFLCPSNFPPQPLPFHLFPYSRLPRVPVGALRTSLLEKGKQRG